MLADQIKRIVVEIFKVLMGDIDAIHKKLDTIKEYEKYVNTDLDYCYLYGASRDINNPNSDFSAAMPANSLMNINLKIKDTNMDLDDSNSVLLKAGKKYKITASAMTNTNGVGLWIVNAETKQRLRTDELIASYLSTSSYSNGPVITFIQPEEDVYVNMLATGAITVWYTYSWFTVEEVGRAVSIDSGTGGGGSITITQSQINDAIEKSLEELNA